MRYLCFGPKVEKEKNIKVLRWSLEIARQLVRPIQPKSALTPHLDVTMSRPQKIRNIFFKWYLLLNSSICISLLKFLICCNHHINYPKRLLKWQSGLLKSGRPSRVSLIWNLLNIQNLI